MMKKTEGGFIALTSVLIIGAVIIILGVSIFYASLTDQAISTAYQSSQEAAFLADFCLKEGVLRLKENIDYMGAEDIKVDDTTCYISLVENVDDNTKKVSSLGRAGDQPHFSRSSQLIRYVIEPSVDGWVLKEGESEKLEITEEGFLKLKRFEEKIILNSPPGESCDTLCPQEEAGYYCISIGIDPAASEGNMWTALPENEGYICTGEGAECGSIMLDHSQELSDCYGYAPSWTYCKCKHEEAEVYRISPEFDVSGQNTVKDSQIFWQADEKFDGTIKVEVRVFNGVEWGEWEQVANGASIPGLEPGTSLSGAKIQTKTSFIGGPDCPSLKNIKIFIELEENK